MLMWFFLILIQKLILHHMLIPTFFVKRVS